MQKTFTLWFFFILFTCTALFPIVWMFGNSVYEQGAFSFSYYHDTFFTQKYVMVIARSLILASATTVFSAFAGIPAGFFLAKTDFPLKTFFKVCFFIPLIVPSYTIGIAWTNILGKAGFLNQLLSRYFFLAPQSIYDFIYSVYGAAFILSINLFPLIMLMTEYALKNVPSHLEEYGLIQGSFFQVQKGIVFPLILPSIFSGMMIVFVLSLSEFGVPSLLQQNVLITQIFTEFSAFYNEKAATAIALPLIIITTAVCVCERYIMRGKSYEIIGKGASHSTITYHFPWLKGAGFVFFTLIFLLYIVLPFCSLFFGIQTFAVYRDAFPMAKKGVINSVLFGCIGASVLTVIGFFLGYASEKTRWKGKQEMASFIWIFFAIPATIVGVGLIKLWNRPDGFFPLIYGSLWIIIMGYVIRFTPLASRIMANFFRNIPQSMEEAGVITGASWFRTISSIIVPLQKNGILATWVIIFIFCIGELGTTILVYPPGHETLPIALFTVMANSPEDIVSALTVILIFMTLLPVGIFFMASKYFFSRKTAK
ncbi:MAG: iron ABC transporter permease [Candidatus Brocadiaceae bacterium]|nr:iron ABC transporter permease [Candidatus Brocadiaceae bacterium]